MATVPNFDQFQPTATSGGADAAFPGSSSASDDSLSGVSAALGTVPVAVSANPNARAPKARQPAGGFFSKFASLAAGLDQGVPAFNIKPITEAILDLDKLSRAQRATVQDALYRAGYFSSSYYGKTPPIIVPGEIDSATRAAYRAAVEDAARQSRYDPRTNTLVEPVTVDQVIRDRITNRAAQGVPSSGGYGTASAAQAPPTPQVVLTSPDDIRAQVAAEARAQYGHKADDALVNTIISRYQQLQSAAQSSTAATVTNPPSLAAFTSQQLRTARPAEVAANRGLEVGNLFMQAFQSGAGQQPTPTG